MARSCHNRKLDADRPKGKVVLEVNELHTVINELHINIKELNDRIERLRKECPVSWKAEHSEIDRRLGHVGRKIEDVIDAISYSDVSG